MTYTEKLKDSRWQKRRLEMMEKAGFKCTSDICSSEENAILNVHHRIYIRGKNPWEYEDQHLQVLCESCHKFQQTIMDEAQMAIANNPGLEWFCSNFLRFPESMKNQVLDLITSVCASELNYETNEAIANVASRVVRLFHLGKSQGYLMGKTLSDKDQ